MLHTHAIAFDAPQGIDPAVIAQIAALAAQEAAALAAKNWPLAITLAIQIAGLIASLFGPTPPPPAPPAHP